MIFVRLSFLMLLLGLVSCSSPADKTLLDYEQSLGKADSLVHTGRVDSASAVRLLTGLHQKYDRVKELSGGRRVRLAASDGKERLISGILAFVMLGVVIRLISLSVEVKKEKVHRHYTVSLTENEQHLRNNEREITELQTCLDELPVTDERREEVLSYLSALMNRNESLHTENKSLRLRLKEFEKRPLPRDLELLKEQDERIRRLDGQVQSLTATLIDRDEVVERLRRSPKYLSDADWKHLRQLADRVYSHFGRRLTDTFAHLTPADLQLCLLVRLHFTNAQIATLIAVSSASVSQQKFRLKKRLLQEDETLFKNGETLDLFIWNF